MFNRFPYIYIVLFFFATSALAQDANKDSREQLKTQNDTIYRGFSVHLDIFSPVMGIISSPGIFTMEAQADVNILDRFYPTIEAGYGVGDIESKEGAKYKFSAPYMRLGMNFGLIKPINKKGERVDVSSYPFVGLRYGMSFLNYTLDNISINDGYWNNSKNLVYSSPLAYCGWVEVVAGVRVRIAKGFTMGLSGRFHLLLHSNNDKNKTYYIPGFGKTAESTFSLNYTVGYTF